VIASIGDDTLWATRATTASRAATATTNSGAAPATISSPIPGDDNIQGMTGTTSSHAGNGVNLVLGGFGKDFIVTGEDASEAFGGPGDDFILGSDGNEQDMGNEGDDWLQGGLLDGSPGDNFDPLGMDRIIGNDVYVGSGGPDIMNAEGGDDIMVGSSGPGTSTWAQSGFDWPPSRTTGPAWPWTWTSRALNAAPGPVAAGILARFSAVEGLAGSAFSDMLTGDNANAAVIATAGRQGSVWTNIGSSTACRTSWAPGSPRSARATSSWAATGAT